MEQIKLNDALVAYVKGKPAFTKGLYLIAAIVNEIEETIDDDSKLRKNYGVGSVFQVSRTTKHKEIICLLKDIDHHYELCDPLLNREIATLSELLNAIQVCNHSAVVFALQYDEKLFAVFLNDITIFEDDMCAYQLMAVVIEDDSQKVESVNPDLIPKEQSSA